MAEKILTESEFKVLWKLNEEFVTERQNYRNTFYYCSTLVENETYLPTGELLTIDLLIERYKNYLQNWDRSIGQRGKAYIGKDDKIKPIYDYLIDKMYESNIRNTPIESDPRYDIVFGGIPEEVIRKNFNEFRKVIQ